MGEQAEADIGMPKLQKCLKNQQAWSQIVGNGRIIKVGISLKIGTVAALHFRSATLSNRSGKIGGAHGEINWQPPNDGNEYGMGPIDEG
jgi:hypothetical protein